MKRRMRTKRSTICAAMDNDLNTSLAVTALYDVLKYKTNDATKLATIADFDRVLSLSLIEKADALNDEAANISKASGWDWIASTSWASAT